MTKDILLDFIRKKYTDKGMEWQKSDDIVFGFWTRIFPYIAWIPILFWILKKIFIDYMLHKKGFEETIIYLAIIIMIRPMITELFTKITNLKK